jgi:hypothetical protein
LEAQAPAVDPELSLEWLKTDRSPEEMICDLPAVASAPLNPVGKKQTCYLA